jgi:plastocyanin
MVAEGAEGRNEIGTVAGAFNSVSRNSISDRRRRARDRALERTLSLCAAASVCLLAAGLLSIAAPARLSAAATGVIRGSVNLPPAPPRVERRPSVSQLGGNRVDLLDPPAPGSAAAHRHDEPPEPTVSVVYLERAPRGAFSELDERRGRMDQRGERFVPHVLAITVGSLVDFPNNDRTYHNVFSLSDTRTFDLGRYAAGNSKAVRFDRPGIVRVFCDIHSHMNAFILVFAHRYFAMTDAEGRFHIDNVPPGTYTVMMWNEAWPSESRQVVVPDTGGEVEVTFAPTRVRTAS